MKVMNKIILLCLSCITILGCGTKKEKTEDSSEAKVNKNDLFLLVGSYSSAEAEGIKLFRFNEETCAMSYVDGVKGISNPSYQNVSNDGNYIYSVGEDDEDLATVNAIQLDKEKGKLTLLNSQLVGEGAPCYIRVSPNGRFLLTANYMGGSISVFPIEKDGKIGARPYTIRYKGHGQDSQRQEQPHLHCVEFTPDGKHLVANDLGLDCIHKYPVAGNGPKVTQSNFINTKNKKDIKLESGSGLRHICFRPDGKFAYLINELSGAVTVLSYNKELLNPIQYIQSDTVYGRGSADIHVSPDGKFVYSSNRLKADGIAIFKVDEKNGTLSRVGYQLTGVHPRNFIITPNGRFLLVACRDSNCIQIFSRNVTTGALTEVGKVAVSKPVCLKFISK